MRRRAVRYDYHLGRYVVALEFDEDDLNDLAAAVGYSDGFAEDCLVIASELHDLNHSEEEGV